MRNMKTLGFLCFLAAIAVSQPAQLIDKLSAIIPAIQRTVCMLFAC